MIRSDVRLASTVLRFALQLGLLALGNWACGQGDELCDARADETVVLTVGPAFVDGGHLAGLTVEARFTGTNWSPCRWTVPSETVPDSYEVVCYSNRAGPVSVRAVYDDGGIREGTFETVGDDCGPFQPVRVALEDLPVVAEGSGEGSGDP